jgi:hypothetical protein
MARPQCDTTLLGMGTRTQTIIVNVFLKTGSGYVCKKVDLKKES